MKALWKECLKVEVEAGAADLAVKSEVTFMVAVLVELALTAITKMNQIANLNLLPLGLSLLSSQL